MEWNKVKILYFIITLLSFFLIILSYYFFKEYIIVFVIVFAFIIELFPWFLRKDPNKSPFETFVGGFIGEQKYTKHKISIWIIYIAIIIIIAFLVTFVFHFG